MKSLFDLLQLSTLLLFLFLFSSTYGQDTIIHKQVLKKDSLYLIKFKGNAKWTPAKYQGYDNGRYFVSLFEKDINLQLVKLRNVSPISSAAIKKGKYYYSDINESKYAFSNPAFALKKGSFRLHALYYGILSIEYGINKYISVEAGGSLFGMNSNLIFAKARASIPLSPRFSFGMSYTYVTSISYPKYPTVSYAFAGAYLTYGNRNNNITAGISTGSFYLTKAYENRVELNPTYNLSSKIRLGPKLFLTAEAWALPYGTNYYYFGYPNGEKPATYQVLGFLGVEFKFRNSSLGVGLDFAPNNNKFGFTPVPVINYSIRF